MRARRTGIIWALLNLAVIAGMLFGAWQIILHRQDIVDWWRLRSYTPSAEVKKLADDTAMTAYGRNLFYASDPKIDDREAFNQACNNSLGEQGAVLGCYARQGIFIFNVNDPRLPGVKDVTAAHETLHAVYDRLDTTTKNQVNNWLHVELAKRANDSDLQATIALYNKSEPGELLNEMHSILGTEYSSLTPELEQYYNKYFNRSVVVGFATSYKGVFAASKARIASYQNQLTSLKAQIDANTEMLQQKQSSLQAQSDELDTLRHSDPATYNSRVAGFNAQVTSYNQLVRSTQSLINQYNSIVDKEKDEIALQTDLNHSLNSNYQPVSTQ